MTATELRTLVQRLFEENRLGPVYSAAGRRISLGELEQRALDDPGFAGQLVQWFSDAGELLPSFISRPALVRANRFLLTPDSSEIDLVVAWAYSLNLAASAAQSDLLRAIVLCPDQMPESAAELLGIDPEVVSLFIELFWDVVERRQAAFFIPRLLRRRRSVDSSRAWRRDGRTVDLLQVAHEMKSVDAVLAAAGISKLDCAQSKSLLARRRSLRLKSVAASVALGRISQRQNPHLKTVLRQIAARRHVQTNAKNEPDISPAESVQLVIDQMREATSSPSTIEATSINDEEL